MVTIEVGDDRHRELGKFRTLWEVEGFLIIRERGFKAKKAV